MSNRYFYQEIFEKAKEDPTPENLMELGLWFQNYGQMFWNGEVYDCEGGLTLVPDYKEYYVVQARRFGEKEWEDLDTTDNPDPVIEKHKAENTGYEYRAEPDYGDLIGFHFK